MRMPGFNSAIGKRDAEGKYNTMDDDTIVETSADLTSIIGARQRWISWKLFESSPPKRELIYNNLECIGTK